MAFENIKTIITHPGQAHRDDFIATALVLASANRQAESPVYVRVLRRTPTPEEMQDPTVVVLDVGGSWDPFLNNYDHHQFQKDDSLCTISLVLKELAMYELAKAAWPWLTFTEVLDNNGPVMAASFADMPVEAINSSMSPIEMMAIMDFGDHTTIEPFDHELHAFLTQTGRQLINYLYSMQGVLDKMDCRSHVHNINGVKVIDARELGRIAPKILHDGIEMWLKAHDHDDAGVIISSDDRGPGFSLYRRNDHPSVDFRRLEGSLCISFVHKVGFLAKTVMMCDPLKLVEQAISPPTTKAPPGRLIMGHDDMVELAEEASDRVAAEVAACDAAVTAVACVVPLAVTSPCMDFDKHNPSHKIWHVQDHSGQWYRAISGFDANGTVQIGKAMTRTEVTEEEVQQRLFKHKFKMQAHVAVPANVSGAVSD